MIDPRVKRIMELNEIIENRARKKKEARKARERKLNAREKHMYLHELLAKHKKGPDPKRAKNLARKEMVYKTVELEITNDPFAAPWDCRFLFDEDSDI